MRIHRYTQWDGTQEIRFPTTEDLLKHLSDNLLEEEGIRRALRDLMRRGFTSEDGQRSVRGLRDFLRQAEEKRRELLNRYSPDSFKLSPEEARALSDKLNSLAEKLEAYHEKMKNFMERLSGRYAADMNELARKMQEAYRRYQELRQRLQNQIAERSMRRPGNLAGQDPQALMEMLDRLSKLLEDENFLQNLPNLLDAAVEDLDAMLENLDSLTQEQLGQLSDMLNQMHQLEQLLNQYPFQGTQRMGMGEAGQILGQLRGLERFLRWGQRGMGDPSDLDLEEIRRLLGEEAYENLKYLKEVEQRLEDEGYIVRTNYGLRLTPKGMRKIGDKALREIFQMLNKNRWGDHPTGLRGFLGDRIEQTKRYEFGDPLHVNIGETLMNSLESGKRGIPLRIGPEDFAVHRVEYSTTSETVLLIDVSYSMLMNDALHAGKKVALALHRLIETKYPQDTLHLVAFRSNAKLIRAEDLPSIVSLTYFMEHGTDIKEALRFARQLLGPHRAANRQIILITDGEPTAANLDRGGRLHSGWGSAMLHGRIVRETLKEVKRCTQSGIKINTFMLGTDFYRQGFVDQLSRLNTGRVFYTSPDQIGTYIMVDYIANKRKRIGR
ncbi:MAG TPA: VWA domain-containing protein [candidate division Zixibacteria bacterium]|nr:VWA domain-containing protein [candidate division Zixibacteria bacterium]